jgi:hypothetical protein
LQAIDSTFARYEHYLSADLDLHGKHVLEIGPGHNVGVALRFVAAGADQVVAVDKFVPFQ